MITVVHVVGVMNRGGLETFVMNVLRNIDSRIVHSDILCTLSGVGDYDREATDCGATIYHMSEAFSNHSGKTRFYFQYRNYVSWFKQHHYDVIHIHGSHAFDNSIAVKGALDAGCKKVICHSHTNSGDHWVLNSLGAHYLRKKKILRFACSRQAGEWLYGNNNCFEIIKNGIEVNRFKFSHSDRREYRASLGISDDVKVIMSVGRLVDVKNHSFLLHIMRALLDLNPKGWLLLLIGEGENEGALRDEARALGIDGQIRFLGLRDDIPSLLSSSDAYVMPSIHEGLPLAAVEAQANGLPTFLSSGISPETKLLPSTYVLELESGSLSWAHAINNALINSRRILDAANAAAIVKSMGFDISQTVERLQAIYTSDRFL